MQSIVSGPWPQVLSSGKPKAPSPAWAQCWAAGCLLWRTEALGRAADDVLAEPSCRKSTMVIIVRPSH